MEHNIWEKNINALKKKFPDFEKKIQSKIEVSPNIDVKIGESYHGEKISIVSKGNKTYYLSGKYNPEAFAERQAEQISGMDFGAVVCVIGFADGRVIRYLKKRLHKDMMLLVYEPSVEIFIHTMKNYDIADLFEESAILLFIEGINENELPNILSRSISVDNVIKIKPFILGNYENLFRKQVKEVITILHKLVYKIRFNWNTRIFFAKKSIVNCICNGKYIYRHYSVNSLYHMIPEGVPVIVVGAGPSLDKNIDLLIEAKGKACIIACDTALKPLLKRDIIPDFFMVVDPGKSLELFEEPRIKNIPLISGIDIPVQVMHEHTGKKFLYYDTWFEWELCRYVFGEELEKHPMDSVPSGGSVATSAFSMGRLMGAKTIILIGQDLALSGKKEHAADTFKVERKINATREELPKVEGIDGQMIPTLPNLKIYLEWFENQIQRYKEICVIDATEGGALIHGTKIMNLREAIDGYCNNSFDIPSYLDLQETYFTDRDREKALEFFKLLPNRLEKIQEHIVEGKRYYKKLKKCVSRTSYSTADVRKILKKIEKINKALDEDSFVMLLSEGIKEEEYLLRVTMYQFEDDERKDFLESAKMGSVFLEKLEEQLKEVMPEFEKLSKFNGEYEI